MTKLFEPEINRITDEALRNFVRDYLEHFTPRYFFTIGASASGKHHPKFAQGEGGLVRHTIAASMVLDELFRLSTYAYIPPRYKDYARVAILLHDTIKYGFDDDEIDKGAYMAHARNAAENVAEYWLTHFDTPCPELLYNAILSHMGQWSDPETAMRPFTQIDRAVHMADYIASRNFINIEIPAE